jgi:hypothetical protein
VEAITAMRPINGNEAGATWFAPNRAKFFGETMSTQTSHTTSPGASAWRDQFRLTHTFHLSLTTNEPIAGQVESTLQRSKAKVDKWVISRRGGFYDHCITVEGIGDESARELRREFASLNGEIKVHVEHMVHFAGAAAHR